MAFQCTVATPEGLVFDQSVTGAIVPAHDGQIGVLTGRAPILLKLGAGALRVHGAGGKDTVLFVAGGVAQMKDDVLTILTDEATAPEKLDVEAAKKLVEEANHQIETPAGEAAAATRRRKLDRAKAILRLTGHAA
jgi:F-type H+-transporting ATPase subunit epsilon